MAQFGFNLELARWVFAIVFGVLIFGGFIHVFIGNIFIDILYWCLVFGVVGLFLYLFFKKKFNELNKDSNGMKVVNADFKELRR